MDVPQYFHISFEQLISLYAFTLICQELQRLESLNYHAVYIHVVYMTFTAYNSCITCKPDCHEMKPTTLLD